MRSHLFGVAMLMIAVGCSNAASDAALAGVEDGPPASVEGLVPPEEPEPVTLCDTLECCEAELEVADLPCVDAELVQGACRLDYAEDGSSCGDGDPCTGAPVCQDGECVPGAGLDCSEVDGGPCFVGVCDSDTGECSVVALEDGSECGDGDSCNGVETCFGGDCVPGPALQCEDENGCTVDSCDADEGCVFAPDDGATCSDKNVCTHGDVCTGGACEGGENVCTCVDDVGCAGMGPPCDAPLICSQGQCVPGPGDPVSCDDGNDCTEDVCDQATGQCAFVPTVGPCDDGDPCTAADQCLAGACGGTLKLCDDGDPCTVGETCDPLSGECTEGVYECELCEDVDDCPALGPCEGEFECQDGGCVVVDGSAVDCSDLVPGPCQSVQCDPLTESCLQVPFDDGTTCDDGNACTVDDACAAGICVSGAPAKCGDAQECTDDSCEPATGCVNAPLSGAPCDDSNACTVADTCAGGICEGAAPLVCEDGNDCTQDSCVPSFGCTFEVVFQAPCDDGDACTVGEACSGIGACTGGANVCGCQTDADCPDDDDLCNGLPICVDSACVVDPDAETDCSATQVGPCQVAVCAPQTGSCKATKAKNGTPCDDSDECTSGDICAGGLCFGIGLTCDDGEACTNDSCDSNSGCVFEVTSGPCDDGNACTQGETCSSGTCAGGATIDCTDGNICTADTCSPAIGCSYSDALGFCDDGDACTEVDACIGGVCEGKAKVCEGGDACNVAQCTPASGFCGTVPIDCDDSDACTDDSCQEGTGCVQVGTTCDDGDACTEDSCDPATGCVFENTVCSDGDPCTDDLCDPSGGCSFPVADCDDSSVCTVDTCLDGVGCQHAAVDCTEQNPCFTGACDPVDGCLAEFVDCSDGDECTADSCLIATGECSSEAIDCDDLDLCTVDSCDPAVGCIGEAITCDDGIACTVDSCEADAGDCLNDPFDGLCDDGDPCTIDTCDGGAGCSWEPDPNAVGCSDECTGLSAGTACDDGDPDTLGDFCLGGGCAGFTPHLNEPAAGAWLDKVRRIDGTWYATGGDEAGEDADERGWVAKLENGGVSIVASTIRVDEEYTALTDQLAATDGGSIAYQSGGWSMDSQVAQHFQNGPVSPENIGAAWGATLPVLGGGYWISGRSGDPKKSWVVFCTTSLFFPCSEQGVSAGNISFANNEIPRAMTGWLTGLSNDTFDALGKVLVADFSDNGSSQPYWNDAFASTSALEGWKLAHTDLSPSQEESRDVFGTGDHNVWWVGSNGLLRGRWSKASGNGWSNLPGVISSQGSYDLNGVWANESNLLVAGVRYEFSGLTLALVVHPLETGHSNPTNWHTVDLISLDYPDDSGLPGELRDVWRGGGHIILTGWMVDDDVVKTLHLVRSAP